MNLIALFIVATSGLASFEPVLSSETSLVSPSVEYLLPNQMKEVVVSDRRLSILCTLGQQISVANTFMSSYLVFIDSPHDLEVFVDSNETKIVEHFGKSRWTQPVIKWLDRSVITKLMIRSFSRQCIGIVSSRSFRLQLSIKTIDFYRLSYFMSGLLLFILGPRISRSSFFYYSSCITIGTFASFLIILVVIGRYFPRKISAIVILLGSSAMACALKILGQSVQQFLEDYSYYVFVYALISAFISFALSYRFGPITDHKTLNLIQWLLQAIGLALIAFSSQIVLYSGGTLLSLVICRCLPVKRLTNFTHKSGKTKIKLLTESEFEQQSDVQTKKGLEELKNYCRSPECNAWRVVCKLKDPIRFARFITGENHISDAEIVMYENSDSKHSFETNSINDNNEEVDHCLSDCESERSSGDLIS